MSINQLNDDGAVIGYKPNLQYIKKNNIESVTEEENLATDSSDEIDFTNTVSSFSNNLPNTSLSTIEFVQDNLKSLIDKLSNYFDKGDWNKYNEISSLLSAIDNKNNEYINNFVDYHEDKINGSSIPELIKIIYDANERLETLSNTLKYLYYGDSNLSLEEIKEIDEAYLNKIEAYETNKEYEKINYFTLANDSMLSRSVNLYAFSVNEQAIDIADIIISNDNIITETSKIYLIEKMFNDINQDYKNRNNTYEQQQNIEIMQKTLYNYYNKRQEIIDLYEMFDGNEESYFIGNKIVSYTNELNNAITEINKSFVGNQYYLSELVKIEQEKYYLRNIYSNFNYKSEE